MRPLGRVEFTNSLDLGVPSLAQFSLPHHGPSRAATEENVTGFQHLGLPLNQQALHSRRGGPVGQRPKF